MHAYHRFLVLILCVSFGIFFGTASAVAASHKGLYVVWERIEGITPVASVPAQIINGVYIPVSYPWSVTRGQAYIDMASGRFRFTVKGLSIGAMPTLLSPIGTTGVVAAVRGTFVCAGAGPGVDTEAVALSLQGDAHLQGALPYEFSCNPEDLMFLLRVAEVVSGAPNIVDSWLAFGAGLRFQEHAP